MDTIRLSPQDNVVVLVRSVPAGARIEVDGEEYILPCELGLGHKLAATAILIGDKIIKYGAPIGSATRDIATGEHVHLHNIRSDYLPTFTLEDGQQFHQHA